MLAASGCDGTLYFSSPSPPGNLNAEFTEDVFGTDGVRLTWEDANVSDDIGFMVYRDGGVLVYLDPWCTDFAGDQICYSASTSYFDTDVARGESHCYAVSSYHYDPVDDLLSGESDRCPEACIAIPLR